MNDLHLENPTFSNCIRQLNKHIGTGHTRVLLEIPVIWYTSIEQKNYVLTERRLNLLTPHNVFCKNMAWFSRGTGYKCCSWEDIDEIIHPDTLSIKRLDRSRIFDHK
jgi:hypothetical protein